MEEEILDKMRKLKEQLLQQDNQGKVTKSFQDIEYLGRIVLADLDSNQTQFQDIFIVIRSDNKQTYYQYYAEDDLIGVQFQGQIIPEKEWMSNNKFEWIKEKIQELEGMNSHISLHQQEKARLDEISKQLQMKEQEIDRYSEIKTGGEIRDVDVKNEIDPNKKVTTNQTFANLVPEAKSYAKVGVVYSNDIQGGSGTFSFVGITADGRIEKLNTLLPTQGTNTTKKVISMNRDGSTVEQEQVSAMVKIQGKENEGFSVRIGSYGTIETDYLRKSNQSEYLHAPVETNRQKPTSVQVRQMMEKHKNIRVDEEIGRAKNQLEENQPTELENINDNPYDNVEDENIIVLSDGTQTTFEKEAMRAKVSIEEFKRKYELQPGEMTPEEKIEAAHEEIEEEFLQMRRR